MFLSSDMDVSECSRCGQQIVQWPFEDGWNHYPYETVNWDLTEKQGCYCKAQPAKVRLTKSDR
jgi:hypothetical protein